MSEMVERVARALMLRVHHDLKPVWIEQAEDVKENWRTLARAAIAAMREPTEGMVEAGDITYATFAEELMDPPQAWSWHRMIDEALK